MARPANQQRDEAIAVIRTLTAEHGRSGARLARERFPDVPRGTWGRWRQQAIGNTASADFAGVESLSMEVRRSIPVPEKLAIDPVPATRRALDFWRTLEELESDARLMRDFALARSSDGAIKVKVPFALYHSHKMRCDLLRLALQQAEAAWGAERAAQLYQTIIGEIFAESPDCQKRILARLQSVQSEAAARGF